MKRLLGYIKFFLMFIGLMYILNNPWESLVKDWLLRTAVGTTTVFMLIDLCKLLYQKFNQKKDKADYHG